MKHAHCLFEIFEAVAPYKNGMGDDFTIEDRRRATLSVTHVCEGKPTKCRLQNVVYGPKLQYYLLSMFAVECSGRKVEFKHGYSRFKKTIVISLEAIGRKRFTFFIQNMYERV